MRTVALIGKPLRRQHSKVMHNAAFSHFGIDAEYSLREIDPDNLETFVEEARRPSYFGFQITAPYKEVIVAHLDHIEEEARQIGAVNSVVREDDGSLIGFNTDAPGFLSSVVGAGVTVEGTPAFVAGAGGAARAVVWALLSSKASHVHIANRTPARAAALAQSLAYLGPTTPVALDDENLKEALAGSRIAVNATTVGMTSPGTAFDVSYLPQDAAVFDLVYVPPRTDLTQSAEERGLVVRNGLDMLVDQAQIAFERWTGISDAGTVMRAALDDWDGAEGEGA